MELTEILVAVKPADIQKTSFQEPVREHSRNGQSFSELLKGISSEEDAVTPKDEVKTSEKTENSKRIASSDDNGKSEVQEKSRNQEKVEKETEIPSEKSENDENVSRPDPYAYAVLNSIREENKNAVNQSVDSEVKIEIGEIKESILDKISGSGDSERAELLVKAGKLEAADDFEFEIVSDDLLALEKAQVSSVENPAEFLGVYEEKNKAGNIYSNEQKNVSPADKLKSKINVTDLRTEKVENEKLVSDPAEPKVKVTMTGSDSATLEMNLNLNQEQAAAFASTDVLSANAQVASSDGSTFQAMLNNQIQANAAEIVKAGNIVLKDNNKGTINLVLHPDDIGNVKLTLSLDGDKITGHIAVNTKEALEVFKNNAESLREAFMKNGFENASFDVSYNQSSGNGQHFAEQNQQNQNLMFGRREYDSLNAVAENHINESVSEEFSGITKFGINIVA